MKEIKTILHHDAQEEIQEVTHWETIDGIRTRVIDVPYSPAKEAWDEEVTSYVHDPEEVFVPEDWKEQQMQEQLNALENTLLGMFDGVKIIANESSPILITRFPIVAKVNLFYKYNNEVYVCMHEDNTLLSGIVTEENFDDWMVKW